MKIALVLITILIVAAIFITLLDEGGTTLTDESEKRNEQLDCITKNTDDPFGCEENTALGLDNEGEIIET